MKMATLSTSENLTNDEQTIGSPGMLRLRPGAAIFDISADQLQVSFANHTATFSSPPVTKGIRSLLAALEGAGERSELVRRAAEAAELEPNFVDYLVEMLLQTKCLYWEAKPVATESDHQAELAEFYASIGEDPSSALFSLAALRPLVVAPAGGAADLSTLLGAGGVTAEVVALSPGTTCEDALTQIKAHMETTPRLMVSWNFPYRLPFARSLNDLSLELGIPILFGACEGVIGRVGPYVIPRNTACLECLNKRLLAHAGSAEMQAFAGYRVRHRDSIAAPWPAHPVFRDAVARLFALEISQIALNLPSQTMGGVIEYSYTDGSVRRHPVFKVPRCEACYAARPRRIPWNARFPAPVVKDGGQ